MPRQLRVGVVLPVVAEVKASQQGGPFREIQADGMVWIARLWLLAVGQIGAHHEQLQGTEQQGNCAKQQHLTGSGHNRQQTPTAQQQQHLGNRQIAPQKPHVPGHGGWGTFGTKIRILIRAGGTVVTEVIATAELVGQGPIESQGQSPKPVVPARMGRQQQAVHGVVTDDEQTGLAQAAQEHRQQQQPWGELGRILSQKGHQADSPGTQDRGRQQDPLGRRGADQRANLSSSAGEASRSMATK